MCGAGQSQQTLFYVRDCTGFGCVALNRFVFGEHPSFDGIPPARAPCTRRGSLHIEAPGVFDGLSKSPSRLLGHSYSHRKYLQLSCKKANYVFEILLDGCLHLAPALPMSLAPQSQLGSISTKNCRPKLQSWPGQ